MTTEAERADYDRARDLFEKRTLRVDKHSGTAKGRAKKRRRLRISRDPWRGK